MATGSGPTSGSSSGGAKPGASTTNRRKRTAAKSGGKTSAKPTRAKKPASATRRTSKPLIVDVEPAAVRTTAKAAAPKAESSGSPSASDGISKETAKTAGLFADGGSAKAATAEKSSTPAESEDKSKAAPSDAGSTSPNSKEATVPARAASSSGPSPFYLFAAGLIGALLALALMFLAIVSGFIAPRDDRVDQQAQALATLNDRVTGRLTSLETQIGEVRTALADQVEPISARLDALDAAVSGGIPTVSDGDPSGAVLEAVQSDIADNRSELEALAAGLSAEVAALQAQLEDLAAIGVGGDAVEVGGGQTNGDGSDAAASGLAETNAEALAALSGDLAEVAGQLSALADAVTDLEARSADEATSRLTLEDRMDGALASLTTELQAQRSAAEAVAEQAAMALEGQSAQVPDALARIGLALDGVTDARNRGAGVLQAIDALTSAAGADEAFAGAVAPLAGLELSGPLSDAALLATFNGVEPAMRAAAPAPEGSGLLGALENRARQMVTIRGPEPAATEADGTTASAHEQIDRLGLLIGAGGYDAALSLANDLPPEVQTASGALIDALQARTALDASLNSVRAVLTNRLITEASGAGATSP
ncbi:MAG: hypothetical protein AAGH43_09035 [Pseudomonadota bacterium]